MFERHQEPAVTTIVGFLQILPISWRDAHYVYGVRLEDMRIFLDRECVFEPLATVLYMTPDNLPWLCLPMPSHRVVRSLHICGKDRNGGDREQHRNHSD